MQRGQRTGPLGEGTGGMSMALLPLDLWPGPRAEPDRGAEPRRALTQPSGQACGTGQGRGDVPGAASDGRPCTPASCAPAQTTRSWTARGRRRCGHPHAGPSRGHENEGGTVARRSADGPRGHGARRETPGAGGHTGLGLVYVNGPEQGESVETEGRRVAGSSG